MTKPQPSMLRLLSAEAVTTLRLCWMALGQRAWLSALFFVLLLPLIAWRRARLARSGADSASATTSNPFVYAMQ